MGNFLTNRLAHAVNVFFNRDPTTNYWDSGQSSFYRPDRPRLRVGNEKSIVNSVYTKLSMDAAAISIKHAKMDANDRFLEVINSSLNHCLNVEANIDQSGRAFLQDVYMSMLDEGCVAIVPVDTDTELDSTGSFTINSLRTGKIVQWFPRHVVVRLYNDRTGLHEEIRVPKETIAIIENPMYSVMNEQNSTMQRLIRKLNILDAIDEQSGSGKLDLIIQLPYVVKSPLKKQQAEERRTDIERQLTGSKYGVAYTDGTEKITQLNRSVDNNLMTQIEYLTSMLYGQLGMTTGVLDGTADEKTMTNYYNRTVEPMTAAAVDGMRRRFVTNTDRDQRQSLVAFRDPFKLVPISQMADIADKFTRNEIMSSNEVRQGIGMVPSSDPKADELKNKNIAHPSTDQPPIETVKEESK